MVRRGILLVLAGGFWLLGATVLYRHLEVSAIFQPNRGKETTQSLSFRFPFTIPGTNLVALELKGYEGLYLEDGTKEKVSNVAALIIRNDGTELLEKAYVELWQGHEKLCFELNYLPAGEKILVLESNQSKYLPDKISNCTGSETLAQKDLPGLVTIREVNSKTLAIANPGPIPLRNLTIYFKNYDPESAIFWGGIVYEIYVYRIAPGETYIARPQYYSSGISRIVNIKTSG